MRPSRRLGYRFHVGFEAGSKTLNLAFRNPGDLGVGIQARSLTVSGAPYTYMIGAGDDLAVKLPNPGTYDLSLHGPNGFFRHFGGSPATVLGVEAHGDDRAGTLTLRITDNARGRRPRPIALEIANAYGPDHRTELQGTRDLTIDTRHSGGWYDIALTSPSDPSFSYQLAGRLESAGPLTSDPQLGRS